MTERRVHPRETKLEIIQRIHAGTSVAAIAEARDISPSLIYLWLRQHRDGQLAEQPDSGDPDQPATQPADHPTIRAATKRGGRARKKRTSRQPASRAAESLGSEKVRQRDTLPAAKPSGRAANQPDGRAVDELRGQLAERDAKIRELQRVVRALRAALDAVVLSE